MNKKALFGGVAGLVVVAIAGYFFFFHMPASKRQNAAYAQLETLQMEYAANKVLADSLPRMAEEISKLGTEQTSAMEMFAFDATKLKEKLDLLSKEKNLSLKSLEIGEKKTLSFSEEKGFEDAAEGTFFGQEVRVTLSGSAKGFQTALGNWAAALDPTISWRELKLEPGAKDKKGKQDVLASATLWVLASEPSNLEQALAVAKEYATKTPAPLTPFPKPSALMPKPGLVEEQIVNVQAESARLKTLTNYVAQLKTEKQRLEAMPKATEWLKTQGEKSKQMFTEKVTEWGSKKKLEALTVAF